MHRYIAKTAGSFGTSKSKQLQDGDWKVRLAHFCHGTVFQVPESALLRRTDLLWPTWSIDFRCYRGRGRRGKIPKISRTGWHRCAIQSDSEYDFRKEGSVSQKNRRMGRRSINERGDELLD
jgi:hypothetical protein